MKSARMLAAEVAARQVTIRDFATSPVHPAVTFIVDGKEYKCQLETLCLISPVIREMVRKQADSRKMAFPVFNFSEIKDPHGYFNVFLDLVAGEEIEINASNAVFLNYIATKLQIHPLEMQTSQNITLTEANVIEVAKNLGEHGLPTKEATQYIVHHWHLFEGKKELLTLPKETLDEIIENEDFEPQSESVLFDMICELVETRGHEFCTLFSLCLMKKLSTSQMKKFVELVSLDEIPPPVFDGLEWRLVCNLEEEEDEAEPPMRREDPKLDMQMYAPPSMARQLQPPVQQTMSAKEQPKKQQQPATNITRQQSTEMRQTSTVSNTKTNTQKTTKTISQPPAKPQTPPVQVPAQAPTTATRPATVIAAPAKKSIYNPVSEYKWYESYDDDDMIDGVFRQMKREVSTREWNKYVSVSGGGSKDKMLCHIFEFEPNIMFEYHWDNYDSKEGIKPANAWLKFQFPEHKLVLTHYTIATSSKQFPYNSQPKSWKLEGSNDGRSWVLLSQVKNCDKLRDKIALATFPTQAKGKTAYSHFKLTQLENCAKPSAQNYGEMRINAIEFYGTLIRT